MFEDVFLSLLQTHCEVQDNLSACHATEQKILSLPHWNHKISSHVLQSAHGKIPDSCKKKPMII